MGRLPRARLRARRRGDARLAQRQRPDRALPRRREGAREGGALAGVRASTARSARSTSRAGRASRRCSRASGTPLVYEVFDVLEVDGVPVLDLPLDRAARAARGAARQARADRAALRPLRRRRGAARGGDASRGSRASMAKRARLPLRRGQAHARLAEGQDARPPGVRDLRLHEGARAALGPVRRARPRVSGGATSWRTRASGHRLHRRDDRRAPREAAARWEAERSRRSRSSRRCRR